MYTAQNQTQEADNNDGEFVELYQGNSNHIDQYSNGDERLKDDEEMEIEPLNSTSQN